LVVCQVLFAKVVVATSSGGLLALLLAGLPVGRTVDIYIRPYSVGSILWWPSKDGGRPICEPQIFQIRSNPRFLGKIKFGRNEYITSTVLLPNFPRSVKA